MSHKIKGNKNDNGGGGEDTDNTYATGGGGSEVSFHKLLPNIAEAVDILDIATVEEVQQKVQEVTAMRYAKSELILGLENGRQLGLFELEREFKLNTKYSNELKAMNGDLRKIKSFVREIIQEERQTDSGARFRRSGRMRTKSKKSEKSRLAEDRSLQMMDKVKVCDGCKKKINDISMVSNSESVPRDSESDVSVESETSTGKRPAPRPEGTESKRKKLPSLEEQKSNRTPQKKSKLLVEKNKNPMENELYLDWFT